MMQKSISFIFSMLLVLSLTAAFAANAKSRSAAQSSEEPANLKGEVAPGDETVSNQHTPGSQTEQTEVPLPNNGESDPQQPGQTNHEPQSGKGEDAAPKEPEFKAVKLKTTDRSKNSKSFVDLNNQGLAELKTKNYYAAVEKFAAALGLNPYSAEVQINFAIALENLGKTDEALRALQSSATISDNPEVKFISEYNQGVLLSKGEDKEQALSHYQKALDINPESFETKVNIELLTGENGGKGKSDKQDKENKDQKDNQDKKDKGDGKDSKDPKDKDKGEDPKEDQPKKYGKNNPQPKPFKSEELTQGDVNKILNELRQQEQKIRAEFNKKIIKEKPRDKDW